MDQHKNSSARWVLAVAAATEDSGSLGVTPGPATLGFHMTALPPAPLEDDPLIHSASLPACPCQLPQICLIPSISFHLVKVLGDLLVQNGAGEAGALPKHCLRDRSEQKKNEPEMGTNLPDQVTSTKNKWNQRHEIHILPLHL